jgi:2-iminobutanoate/2-iminopropanoate deaminase
MDREAVRTENAPQPGGAYSQGIAWERLVFASGQVAADPATRQPVSDDVRVQTRQVLSNLRAVLEAAGADMSSVLKTTCFLADINDFAAFNEEYQEFFPSDPPARSTIQAGLVAPWRVEVEAVAIRLA